MCCDDSGKYWGSARDHDNGGRLSITEYEVVQCRSMSFDLISGHIEGILRVYRVISRVRNNVGMIYEHIAGCSTSFRA